MNKNTKNLNQMLDVYKKDIILSNTTNTYMQYKNATGENSINEYCNNTFNKNSINMLQFEHDILSILTCDALGLLIWGNMLGISRQTQIPNYFMNVGLYELGEDAKANFNVESQTNDNFEGNFNNEYIQSSLTDEEFRKCILLKYRGQWCCGTIFNLSDILNWTFYWKDKYSPTPLEDYPIKFRVLNNEDYILIIESNRTIETPNELESNLRYKYVFQYCNLFPQVGGNAYRFNWVGWEEPNYQPLPDVNHISVQQAIPTIKQLSDAGLLIKYKYGSDMTSQDITPIPVTDTANVMSGTTGYTIFASRNVATNNGLPLRRQYENYMDSCAINTAMSLATGNVAEWVADVQYNKGAVIRQYELDVDVYHNNAWVYYISLEDNNRNPQPRVGLHHGWGIIYAQNSITGKILYLESTRIVSDEYIDTFLENLTQNNWFSNVLQKPVVHQTIGDQSIPVNWICQYQGRAIMQFVGTALIPVGYDFVWSVPLPIPSNGIKASEVYNRCATSISEGNDPMQDMQSYEICPVIIQCDILATGGAIVYLNYPNNRTKPLLVQMALELHLIDN